MPDDLDLPVPLDELRRASTEALMERHVGEPLRNITAELMTEVAGRITAALADLDAVQRRWSPCQHEYTPREQLDCPGCLAARTRATLTGEDT